MEQSSLRDVAADQVHYRVSQDPATERYPESVASSLQPSILFFKDTF
jgi:hypothetical protein